MSEWRRPYWFRAIFGGLAVGLILLLTGDRSGYTATPGIDPLEILKLQVKPNVLVILDTSGSMHEPFTNTPGMGGDFAFSKMAKAKVALNRVLTQNEASINFGFETYFSQNVNKRLVAGDTVFRYVSDSFNANKWTGGTAAPDGTTDFFRASTGTYSQSTGSNVYHSFGHPSILLDFADASATCTAEPCQRFLDSRLIRTDTKFKWNTATIPPTNTTAALDAALVSTTAIDCSLAANHAPLRLFPDDPDVDNDGLTDIPRACIQMEDSAGTVTTFWFSTGNWEENGADNCDGAALISAVASCGVDNVPAILAHLRPELPINGECGQPVGIPCGGAVTTSTGTPYATIENTNPATVLALNPDLTLGVIAAGRTPLGGALRYVNTNFSTVFPAAIGGAQGDFVILVTDGLETCGGNAPAEATSLYNHNPRVYTFVIGLAIGGGSLNQIARAGSGGTRDAIPANNVDELIAALNAILDTAIATGSFSASSSIVGTVFELVTDDPATTVVEDPFDPATRYKKRVNILYQSQFGLPGWEGHFFAFENTGAFQPVQNVNFSGNWDAGETLFEQVEQILEEEQRGTNRQPNQFTFQELHNGATVDSIVNENTASGALIKRRIFTSNGNGSFARANFDASAAAGRNVYAIWPPNQTGISGSGVSNTPGVDPAVGTVGVLDNALGIGPASSPVLTYTDLQTKFGACTGSAGGTDPDTGGVYPAVPMPPGCNVVADPTLALNTARKEAREIILAWIAGAEIDRGTADGRPNRAYDAPVTGELIYRDRGYILLDAELTTPAVVSPPLGEDPPGHVAEWLLYQDGQRNTAGLGVDGLKDGFGLTNPDRDDPFPAVKTNLTLKPVMTVVYYGANDGLHAFSALTSEELWNFIPYDQLGKIKDMVNPGQTRSPHIYMIGTALRFGDVFVPGPFTFTTPSGNVTFAGRWRKVMVFGRGPGGKSYTALDITAPGHFTDPVLATNPPWVLWSRGNPDAADPTNYAKMGETWSTPSMGDVSGTSDDFRVFTGSGYGDTPGEGTTFFELNAINGDVIVAKDIADGIGTYIPQNALVAPPAPFNPHQEDSPLTVLRSTPDAITRVYIPDLHGRIYKFDTTSGGLFADVGPTEPFGSGPNTLKLNGSPYVFLESGNDSRVPAGLNPPFRMYAYKDVGSVPAADGDGSLLFSFDFPAGFRGTGRPATGYRLDDTGIVFYVGTRFNPPGADCLSSFDTVLFAFTPTPGVGPGYANGYDFTGDGVKDLSFTITGQRATSISLIGGNVGLSLGGTLSASPPPGGGAGVSFPGPSPTPTPTPQGPAVLATAITNSSPVCRQ